MLFLQRYISAIRNGDQAASKQLGNFIRSVYPDLITSISTEFYDYLKTAPPPIYNLIYEVFRAHSTTYRLRLGTPRWMSHWSYVGNTLRKP